MNLEKSLTIELAMCTDDGMAERAYENHIKENKLAGRVARYKTSYSKEIKPILEKLEYLSKGGRIEPDEEYDGLVKEVLESMKKLGTFPLNPYDFTIEGRKKQIRYVKESSLMIGSIIGMIGLFTCLYVRAAGLPIEETAIKTGAATVIGTITAYTILRKGVNSKRLKELQDGLTKHSERCDNFVRRTTMNVYKGHKRIGCNPTSSD